MKNLLLRLTTDSNKKPIEPREIFMSLPRKDAKYQYPRDVQTDVWRIWSQERDRKNVIIKMNTGSGKTVVGLMILQSCLNDNKGPAIYVVPDKYLVNQVCTEAANLGVQVTKDRNDYNYSNNKSILVMPIDALVNGQSVFGLKNDVNYPIGSILIDDVHTCMERINSKCSVKIQSNHELYRKILNIFEAPLENYSYGSYVNVHDFEDKRQSILVPFWIWKDKYDEVLRLLKQYNNDSNDFIYFSLPLINECFHYCSCVITAHSIEIKPKGIPISKITNFERAERRIFMSATLPDDSVFVSTLGIAEEDMKIITPGKADDIGDRLILFPQHLNPTITDQQLKEKAFFLSKQYNVVVIVPSFKRAEFWTENGATLVTNDSITDIVDRLKSEHLGLVVFAGRYDGIDLPDNACRILIIDGLPSLNSEYDKYVSSINHADNLYVREQVQKIEQGMGRGVRSNNDYCCIVLMGNKLVDILVRRGGISYFSNATREQFNLSKKLWSLLIEETPNPTIDDIFELSDYCLNRDSTWIQESKSRLSEISYENKPTINKVAIALRKAFDNAYVGEWRKAVYELEEITNIETDNNSKGYLMQLKAEFLNFVNQVQAQEVLKSARKYNNRVLAPIHGIEFEKLINKEIQAKAIIEHLKGISQDRNQCLTYINSVLDNFCYPQAYNDFEDALCKIGQILGFKSTRHDPAGPDNLWAIGGDDYLVIECKSEASADSISKDYCGQLLQSVIWFIDKYGEEFDPIPLMAHPSHVVDELASPHPKMRVIDSDCLIRFKRQIQHFAVALVQNENWQNETRISCLLQSYKLRKTDIVQEYSVRFQRVI